MLKFNLYLKCIWYEDKNRVEIFIKKSHNKLIHENFSSIITPISNTPLEL